MTTLDPGWLRDLSESVPRYLAALRTGDQAGRFLPALRGAAPVGREMALGFSCFAMKLHHLLGTWERVPAEERAAWIGFIGSFQEPGEGAFIDPPEIAYLEAHAPWRERAARLLGRPRATSFARSIVLAETKQAIATLVEVDAAAARPFRGFPATPEAVRAWLGALDWSRPWGAGGQAAGLVVFVKTQAPAFLAPRDVEELLTVCRDFYTSLSDRETGAYFRGSSPPARGELINGAMKVLMALDWLEMPPHHPERLIATCLRQPPSPHGCHLVDAVYVLHQCSRGEASAEMRRYGVEVAELIKHHAHDDGGFSFYAGKAQTNYYGVPITRGLDESDVQGTCLLVWALAMISSRRRPPSGTRSGHEIRRRDLRHEAPRDAAHAPAFHRRDPAWGNGKRLLAGYSGGSDRRATGGVSGL